ncbi:MAG: hypothetical protein ABII01_04325 [Candidatus Woesearchaeota archaeon]
MNNEQTRRGFLRSCAALALTGCASKRERYVAEGNRMESNDIQLAEQNQTPLYEVGFEKVNFEMPDGREMRTDFWFPIGYEGKSQGVIFLHGLSKSPISSFVTLKGLARRGYFVAAPHFFDFANAGRIRGDDYKFSIDLDRRALMDFFGEVSIQNLFGNGLDGEEAGRAFNERLEQSRFAIKAIKGYAANNLVNADFEKAVLGGYSLGGWATPYILNEFSDGFITGFVSSPATLWCSKEIIEGINVPMIYITGTIDALYPGSAYHYTQSEKVIGIIKGFGHISSNDIEMKFGMTGKGTGDPKEEAQLIMHLDHGRTENVPVSVPYLVERMNLHGLEAIEAYFDEQASNHQDKALARDELLYRGLDHCAKRKQGALETLLELNDNPWYERVDHRPAKKN